MDADLPKTRGHAEGCRVIRDARVIRSSVPSDTGIGAASISSALFLNQRIGACASG
jgi:hypothetical protein